MQTWPWGKAGDSLASARRRRYRLDQIALHSPRYRPTPASNASLSRRPSGWRRRRSSSPRLDAVQTNNCPGCGRGGGLRARGVPPAMQRLLRRRRRRRRRSSVRRRLAEREKRGARQADQDLMRHRWLASLPATQRRPGRPRGARQRGDERERLPRSPR